MVVVLARSRAGHFPIRTAFPGFAWRFRVRLLILSQLLSTAFQAIRPHRARIRALASIRRDGHGDGIAHIAAVQNHLHRYRTSQRRV
jgi:hypothetical protein